MNGALMYANRVELPKDPPSRILVVPWGNVESKAGDFVVDRESADAMVAAFKAHGADLPIDFEHTTVGGEFASPDGSAPAMAWIHSLSAEEGTGVWADVTWTERGEGFVSRREYRYLSPVVMVRKSDKRAVEVHSVALTNKPAIVGMVPIVNKQKEAIVVNSEETLQQARWFLNLPTTATETEIMNELEKLLGQIRELVGAGADANADAVLNSLKAKLDATSAIKVAVCKALSLAEDAKDEDVVAAVNKAIEKPAPAADAVPASDHAELLTANKAQGDRIKVLEDALQANKRSAFIERGEKEGKIVVANKGMFEQAFDADPEKAEEFLKTAPVVGPGEGRMINGSPRPIAGAGKGDAIIANSDRFDPNGMEQYRRIKEYQTAHKCTYVQACEAVC